MIGIAGAIPIILTRLGKLHVGHGLDLRTFKRDRSVAIMRLGEDEYSIEEAGFRQESCLTDSKGMGKILKTILKREFPRSNKIRIHEIRP